MTTTGFDDDVEGGCIQIKVGGSPCVEILELRATITTLTEQLTERGQEVYELRAALRPFATAADMEWGPSFIGQDLLDDAKAAIHHLLSNCRAEGCPTCLAIRATLTEDTS